MLKSILRPENILYSLEEKVELKVKTETVGTYSRCCTKLKQPSGATLSQLHLALMIVASFFTYKAGLYLL